MGKRPAPLVVGGGNDSTGGAPMNDAVPAPGKTSVAVVVPGLKLSKVSVPTPVRPARKLSRAASEFGCGIRVSGPFGSTPEKVTIPAQQVPGLAKTAAATSTGIAKRELSALVRLGL